MALSDAQTGPPSFRRRLKARPPPVPGLPQLPGSPSLHAVLTTPMDRIRCLSVVLLVRSRTGFLPCPCSLPRSEGGSASISLLSRPAQASLTLRPAKLLTHLSWALSRGSVRFGFPHPTLASYQVLPTTTWAGPSPAGNPRPWGALQNSTFWMNANIQLRAHSQAFAFTW